jgi:hypothetical protein
LRAAGRYHPAQPTGGITMYSIVGILILVLDILAILDCVKSSKEAGQKLLWILLILILPLVGLILYYVVGKGKSS